MLLPDLLCSPFLGWRSFLHSKLLCDMQVAYLSAAEHRNHCCPQCYFICADELMPYCMHPRGQPTTPFSASAFCNHAEHARRPDTFCLYQAQAVPLLPWHVVTDSLLPRMQSPHLQCGLRHCSWQTLEQLRCNAAGADREPDSHHPRWWLSSDSPAARRWGQPNPHASCNPQADSHPHQHAEPRHPAAMHQLHKRSAGLARCRALTLLPCLPSWCEHC